MNFCSFFRKYFLCCYGSSRNRYNNESPSQQTEFPQKQKQCFFVINIPVTTLLPQPELDDTCSICLDHFHYHSCDVYILPCDHKFHTHCLNNWVLTGSACPLCRSIIPVTVLWKEISSN